MARAPREVAHLRCHVDRLAPPLDRLANPLLADAESIGIRGVQQVDTQLHRPLHRADRLLLLDGSPLAADSPAAHADRRDIPAGLAQSPVLHLALSLLSARLTPRQASAVTVISTRAPAGSALTATVVRPGGFTRKNSAYTSFIAANSPMSTR